MALKLVQVLNENFLRQLITETAPVEEIVEGLYNKGYELSEAVRHNAYDSWEDFKTKHCQGNTELIELEGDSDFYGDDILILRECPMISEIKKLYDDGKPPVFHNKIIQDYMEQNPGSNSMLHPGCIAHQVARQLVVKNLNIKGVTDVNYFQLACRSGATGKVVYDNNGLQTIGMSEGQAYRLIDGYGCLYVMVRKTNKSIGEHILSTAGERS